MMRCWVAHARGPYFKTMGRADRDGALWLLPEEMLYLLERGNLDVRWGMGQEEEEMPMSLQGGYAVSIGSELEGKIGLERWSVYAALKRMGYVVMRAPTWLDVSEEEGNPGGDGSRQQRRYDVWELFRRLFGSLFGSRQAVAVTSTTTLGPLVKPGLYRSYSRRILLYLYFPPIDQDD